MMSEQVEMFPKQYTYDNIELSGCIKRVYDAMADGRWITLADLEEKVGLSGSGTSASMRALRKEKNGGHTVERRYIGGRTYEYRLVL